MSLKKVDRAVSERSHQMTKDLESHPCCPATSPEQAPMWWITVLLTSIIGNHGAQPQELSRNLFCNSIALGLVCRIMLVDAHESFAMQHLIIRDDDETSAWGNMPFLKIICNCNALWTWAWLIRYMPICKQFQHLKLRVRQNSVRTFKFPAGATRNCTATDCPHCHLICDDFICH